jgi:cardiolipin synthase
MPMCFSFPNQLTFFRLGIIPVIVGLFYAEGDWAKYARFVCFLAGALTDFFDGYFARLYNQTSALGRVLDPLADKLFVAAVILMMVGFQDIRGFAIVPAVAIVLREIFLSSMRETMMEKQQIIAVHWSGKFKTVFQLTSLGFIMVGADHFGFNSFVYRIGLIGLYLSAFLAFVSAAYYLRQIAKGRSFFLAS